LNSAIDTIITAETPEGIAISIRPAGFAVRCSAFLIDLLIRWAFLLLCIGSMAVGGHFGSGLIFITLFIVNWLYSVIFEMTPAAATPGKRIMGLYVVMASGLPITPAGCLIRNLLRAVDFLPMLYAFGAISMLLRHDARRLGDLAAGTVVAYRHDAQSAGVIGEAEPIAPTVTLSRRQQAAITAFAWRSRRLTPQRADEIAALAAWAAPNGARAGAAASLSSRLLGVARWLHGERPRPARVGAAAAQPE
jgi:uncharacterized RDD family membrane protein YckC